MKTDPKSKAASYVWRTTRRIRTFAYSFGSYCSIPWAIMVRVWGAHFNSLVSWGSSRASYLRLRSPRTSNRNRTYTLVIRSDTLCPLSYRGLVAVRPSGGHTLPPWQTPRKVICHHYLSLEKWKTLFRVDTDGGWYLPGICTCNNRQVGKTDRKTHLVRKCL